MQIRDLTGDVQLDYAGDRWKGLREALITEGKTAEQAVELMGRGWQAQYTKDLLEWEEDQE